MKIRRSNPALALCYAGMVWLAIAVNLMPIFLTTVRVEFGSTTGLSDEQLGRIGAITFAGLVGGILLAGPLADRWEATVQRFWNPSDWRRTRRALGISHSYPVLLATLFIMGIGAGILDMVLSPIVAALQPHKRATALNWLHSFYGIGTVIAVVMGTLTLRSGIDWHWMSLALVGIPLVVALGFVNLDLPPLTPGEEGRRKSLHDLCRTSSFLAINLAIFLGGALELGMAQWLPAYAEMSLGFTCYRLLLLIRVPFQV